MNGVILMAARLVLLLVISLGAAVTLAQDDASPTEAGEEQSAAQDAVEDVDDVDDSDDDVEPVIRDGIFTPSEKIEADSAISFPSDI